MYNGLSLSCLVLTVSNSWADAADSLHTYMTIIYNDITLSYTAAAAAAAAAVAVILFTIIYDSTYSCEFTFRLTRTMRASVRHVIAL